MGHQKNTVDYFPFFVKDGRTLYILKKKYGLKGTGFFTELFRYLSQIPEHWTCLQDEYDRMRFLDFIGINEKECHEILNIMAETGKIDKELWIKKAIILSEDFIDSLERVYSKRQNGLNAQTIKEKTEKIPALPGPDPAHQAPSPALPGLKGKERKGKERKDNNYDSVESQKNLDLFHAVKKVCESEYGVFENYGKEGDAINKIIQKAKSRDPCNPDIIIKKILETFKRLKENGNDFWKSQPFLPSIINSNGIWPRLVEEIRNENKDGKTIETGDIPF